MLDQLNPTFLEYLEKIRNFVIDKLNPISLEVDRNAKVPSTVIREMAQVGLMGLSAPSEYGRMDFSSVECCMVAEEMGKTNKCFLRMLSWGPVNHLVCGTDEQKERYLIPIIKEDLICASALPELFAGSDAASISTTGTRCFALLFDPYLWLGKPYWKPFKTVRRCQISVSVLRPLLSVILSQVSGFGYLITVPSLSFPVRSSIPLLSDPRPLTSAKYPTIRPCIANATGKLLAAEIAPETV